MFDIARLAQLAVEWDPTPLMNQMDQMAGVGQQPNPFQFLATPNQPLQPGAGPFMPTEGQQAPTGVDVPLTQQQRAVLAGMMPKPVEQKFAPAPSVGSAGRGVEFVPMAPGAPGAGGRIAQTRPAPTLAQILYGSGR